MIIDQKMRSLLLFVGKMIISLFVLWVIASIPLWFIYPKVIFRAWEIIFLVIMVPVDALGLIVIILFATVKVMEHEWVSKLFRWPGRYVNWLIRDLRKNDQKDEVDTH